TWQRIYREAAGVFRERRDALTCDGIYRFGFDDKGRQQPWMRAAEELTQFRNEQIGARPRAPGARIPPVAR
ncbi:MAG TPA: hypothetical protein VJU15_06240, partial [Gemmatimonadales bacterium]|nr:hypothetical protein [Gemmatimonadales bacterium]